MSKNLKSVQCN